MTVPYYADDLVTLYHGDSVMIERSLGPLPAVAGKTPAQATTDLQNAGLTVIVSDTREFSDTVPDGNVSSLSVKTEVVRPGDTVTLVLSKGPELVAVPTVTGMTLTKANNALEAAGFKVIIITELPREFWDEPRLSKVTRQSVAGGTKIAKGSTVKIYGRL